MEELEKMKQAYNEFILKAEELAEKIKEKESSVWKPEIIERYYLITERGNITSDQWDDEPYDNNCYEIGNCFKTEEEAEKVKRHLITRAKLQRIADRLNKGQEIDWDNNNQKKNCLYIGINYNNDTKIENEFTYHWKSQGTIYCLDKNFKDIAISEIGQEELEAYLKGE